MIRKLFLIAALALAVPAAAEVHQREYGVATTIPFKLYDTSTGGLDVDEVDGGAEVSLICDGGTAATATNDFVDEGAHYTIALTAAEMQCAYLAIEIAATDTNVVFVETIGNASAAIDDDGGWYDAIPYNSAWDADIQSEAADALTAYDAVVPADLPTNFADLSITATTGRVDVAAIAGTAQTANDNGADINAILVDTGTTLDGAIATIDSNVDAILVDTGTTLPGVLGTPTDFGSGTSTLAANLQDLADNGTATYDRTTDSLQAIRDRGDAAWTTGAGGSCPDDVVCTTVATAPTTTSITATAAPNDDTQLNGWGLLFIDNGDADSYCLRKVSSVSSGTITYNSACPFTVGAGDEVKFLPAYLADGVDVTSISGDSTAADNLEAAFDGAGYNVGGGDIVAASVTGAVGSVTGAVGSVTGNVGGNVTGSVGSVTGGINTSGGTITTLDGLDTAQDTQHSTTQSDIAALNDLDAAGVRTAVGLASANLDTQLGTIDTNVDAVLVDTGTTLDGLIDAIKAVTDQITFGVSGEIDANVESMNGCEVTGDGTTGTEWSGNGTCP